MADTGACALEADDIHKSFGTHEVLKGVSLQAHKGDVISIKASSSAEPAIRDATELTGQVPAWLQADHDTLTAKVLRKPERREVAAPVQEQLIVELYSK